MLHQLIQNPLFFNTIVVMISLVILFKAADLIIYGISNYAKKLGLSDYIIGLVVVAAAASMPEIVASLVGAAMNETGVFFGSILGTIMVHLSLVVGFLAIFGRKISLKFKILEKSKFLIWILFLLPFLLSADGMLSRADGIILVLVFIFYLTVLWRKEGTFGKIKKNILLKNIYRDGLIFMGSLIALLLAGRWLVFSVVTISKNLNINPFFISITAIAIGAAVPDFAIGIRSLLREKQAIGLGDVLGSSLIELLPFFGLVAIFKPIKVDFLEILNVAVFLMIAISLVLWLMKKKTATWKHGLMLIALYLVFIMIEIMKL